MEKACTHSLLHALDTPLLPAPASNTLWLPKQHDDLIDHMGSQIVYRVVVASRSLFPDIRGEFGEFISIEGGCKIQDRTELRVSKTESLLIVFPVSWIDMTASVVHACICAICHRIPF